MNQREDFDSYLWFQVKYKSLNPSVETSGPPWKWSSAGLTQLNLGNGWTEIGLTRRTSSFSLRLGFTFCRLLSLKSAFHLEKEERNKSWEQRLCGGRHPILLRRREIRAKAARRWALILRSRRRNAADPVTAVAFTETTVLSEGLPLTWLSCPCPRAGRALQCPSVTVWWS